MSQSQATLGAVYLGDGRTSFLVWAPNASKIEAHLLGASDQFIPLEKTARGYHSAIVGEVPPGSRYLFRLDGAVERPDPASRFQPGGVHGPSEVVDSSFNWQDATWQGLELDEYIVYEVHVGTFTEPGTLDAAAARLSDLKELGVTAVELMPVAQFPGARNWGYDGTYLYAVQNSYGGPAALKRFVNACHEQGLAAILDVVYNHLGPEGNYLAEFAPYFADRYRTPWGPAMNLDGPWSDEVRRFLIENAVRWVSEFHFDALRLDAIHGIVDTSASPFLMELGEAVQKEGERLNRRIFVIPESDLNDSRIIMSRELGGYGLDAQWSDDLHHSLHTLLTGESAGYYADFGKASQLAEAYRWGFVYRGQHSPYRNRRHGNSTERLSARQFVVFAQNHDQVGNRLLGDRLSRLVSFEPLKLAAAAILLSPFVPLLFMGEEYGEIAPFQFFASHSDPQIVEATRRGRTAEFAAFRWQGEIPDPFDERTFLSAKLHPALAREPRNRLLRDFYKELIRLRREVPALHQLSKENLEVQAWEEEKAVVLRRWAGADQALLVLTFAGHPVTLTFRMPMGAWRKSLDSSDARWSGPGSAVPAGISSGDVPLTLPAHTAVLFTLQDGDQL
jgi:maltooligosyltrehalose trehalohydrolase